MMTKIMCNSYMFGCDPNSKAMIRYQKIIFCMAFLMVCILQSSKAESISGEDTNSYSAVRIAALNKAVVALGSNSLSSQAEIILPSGEKKTAIKIKEELAMRGVCIRWNGSRYIDATKEVTRGYSLKDDEIKMLALMNYLEQNCGLLLLKKVPDLKNTGATTEHIKAIKRNLLKRGISVQWENDLYIIQSVQRNIATNDLKKIGN
ncbi:MAG: hypothetical protein Q7J98_03285 [Kiritimatiellia bacterium]|nr:hypothetical protein [Kiritimatiellia bacterium]